MTSTPADGMVGIDPPAHTAAPTPILPQGIATSAKMHGGSGGSGAGAGAGKKVSRDKAKSKAVVSKKQTTKTIGKIMKPLSSQLKGS